MIAGQLPTDPSILSPGTGPVSIHDNLIQANLANDDGGGIRFLMAGNFPMNVYNNMIVNNVSTHEGGGIAIDDAPNVRVYNNTIMKNLTTATAVTSNGQPAPAGVSTGQNSALLQATLPAGSPTFSNPLLFNNIFWDNRAGTRAGTTVTGIGLRPVMRRRSTTGTSAPRTAPGSWRRPTRSSSRARARTRTPPARPTARGLQPRGLRRVRHGAGVRPVADEPELRRRDPRRRRPPAEGARRLPHRRQHVAGVQRRRGEQGRAGLSAAAREPGCANDGHRRPGSPGARWLRHRRGRDPRADRQPLHHQGPTE